jgi:Ca2+:H+ antiporter
MVKKLKSKTQANTLLKQILIPVIAFTLIIARQSIDSVALLLFLVAFIFICVFSAVHHADIIANKVGEPFGSLVLALSITLIEVSIIISVILNGGSDVAVLARDTVFAAVMIILTGMTGLALLTGGIKYSEPEFSAQGANSALTVLVTISVLAFIFPNFTEAVPGPYYSTEQLIFISIVSLLLYFSFLFVQNFKHKAHYVAIDLLDEQENKPALKTVIASAILLPVNLVAVVMLAHYLAPDLDAFIVYIDAPVALSGIIIACVVLLPEGIASVRAAAKNQMQRSLNLSLGSTLACICLSIPVVSIFAIYTNTPLVLGIGAESMVIFLLSLFVIILSLSKGKTTILQGIVLLLLFAVYLFTTVGG